MGGKAGESANAPLSRERSSENEVEVEGECCRSETGVSMTEGAKMGSQWESFASEQAGVRKLPGPMDFGIWSDQACEAATAAARFV